MWRHYLITAFRTLGRHKLFSLINLAGLAVGMACFTVFALTAGVKLNSDRFHVNGKRIYGVIQVLNSEDGEEEHTAFTPVPLMNSLKDEFAEIQEATRIFPGGRVTLRHTDQYFYENQVHFVDPSFLTMFSFRMVAGNPDVALSDPHSIVMTEGSAKKYFGDEDPVGKVLTLGGSVQVTVTGVMQNIDRGSSLTFDFLAPMKLAETNLLKNQEWDHSVLSTFLMLPEKMDPAVLESKLPGFLKKYFPESQESPKQLYLFSMRDFRVKSDHIDSFLHSTPMYAVIVILGLGIILLLVVSVNFVNLSVIRQVYRFKEIGLRKVVGARRIDLIKQLLGESLLLSFLALPLAVLLYESFHPLIFSYLGSRAAVSNSIFNYPFLWKYLLGTTVFIGLVSGLYPSLFVSSFSPVNVLKGKLSKGKKKYRGYKWMIIFQFSLSVIFIALASVVDEQMEHVVGGDYGFDRDHIAMVRIPQEAQHRLGDLQTEIARQSGVVAVSAASGVPLVWEESVSVRQPSSAIEEAVKMHAYGVREGFVEVFGLKLISGRAFDRARSEEEAILLSQTALDRIGWENPLGERLMHGDRTGVVVGVVDDFLFADIGFEIPPAILYLAPDELHYLYVRYSLNIEFSLMEKTISQVWHGILPDFPIECESLSDHFTQIFDMVNRISGFLSAFGLVAVFFSCLGLIGLTSYLVERRMKEMGVRKVLGASTVRVVWSLIRGFALPIIVANGIGLLVIFFGWKWVLQTGLLFMTPIGVRTYATIVGLTICTAGLSLVSQAMKAARLNPVEVLKCE